jgi:hypothetical protein
LHLSPLAIEGILILRFLIFFVPFFSIRYIKIKFNNEYILKFLGIGDWGLGIWDWGLGIGPNPQSPIPNPPIPNPQLLRKIIFLF